MSQSWDDLLEEVARVQYAFHGGAPASERNFIRTLRKILAHTETPSQFGRLLKQVRGGRTAGLDVGRGTRSHWENGLNVPSDEQVFRKYLLDLDVPSETWIYWRSALRNVRVRRVVSDAAQKKDLQDLGQSIDGAEHTVAIAQSPSDTTEPLAPDAEDISDAPARSEASFDEVVPQPDAKRHDDGPRSLGPKRRRVPLVAVLIGSVVVIVAMIVVPPWWNRARSAEATAAPTQPGPSITSGLSPTPTRTPAESIAFNSPASGAAVTSPLVLHGRGVVLQGREFWVLLRADKGDPRFFVTTDSQIAIDEDGNWSSNLKLGRGPQDEGRSYHLYAITSPVGSIIDGKVLVRPDGQYSVRLVSIPSDSTVVTVIQLKLAKYRDK